VITTNQPKIKTTTMKKKLFTLTLALAFITGGQWKPADAHAAESEEGRQIADADLIAKWVGDLEWVFKGRLAEGKIKGDIEIFEHQQSVAKGTWSADRPKK
jgi:hypothetical protein